MQQHATTIDRFRSYRRKQVKSLGKRLTRRLSDFFGRQSLVGDTPFFDPARFSFTAMLEENWETIRDEVLVVLKQREAIPSFHEVSPDQYRISTGDNWKTFVLFGFKNKLEKNCSLCPETTRILERIPELQTAWFSIITPHYDIPDHRGVTRGVLTCHLGLVIPDAKERCRIRVENEIHHWEQGRTIVFDDSLSHEVWNDTDQGRVVLLLQFNRPMRPFGRLVNAAFLTLVKMTAYYKEPKKNMKRFEDRFQAAVLRAEGFQVTDD
jgi:beta-hydroxylase